METGNIPPKKETSITQNFSYSSGYQEKHGGVTIEIVTQPDFESFRKNRSKK